MAALALVSVTALTVAVGTPMSRAVAADVAEASEQQVKAAYLHKFPGFVEWPAGTFPGPSAPIVIGVLGAEPVYQELLQIAAGRLVQGRTVEVRRLSSPRAQADVHLLFVGRGSTDGAGAGTLASLLAPWREQRVLLVAEQSGALAHGAALNFVERDGRLRFEASLPSAERAGLKLSARLLGVAERVVGSP